MTTQTYDLRINLLFGSPREIAEKLFQQIYQAPLLLAYKEVQAIYEDDGRGNIRDFIYGEFSHDQTRLEIIYARSSNEIINFRLSGPSLSLKQVPSVEENLRFIGENSNHYRLWADKKMAFRLLTLIVTDLERMGIKGYKTDEEKKLDPIRLEYILKGNDPHLVLNNFRKIEYQAGFEKALEYLDKSIIEIREFSKDLLQMTGQILENKNDPRSKNYFW